MDEQTKKLIEERFNALPDSIKEAILSSDYETSLIEIGKMFQLTVAQLGAMEIETTMVMMGLTPTKNLEGDIVRELAIDKLKGKQITEKINEKIFIKIRELLQLMNTSEDEELAPENKETAQGNSPLSPIIIRNEETKVLDSAGIKIIEAKPNLNAPELSAPKRPEVNEAEVLNNAGIKIIEQKVTPGQKPPEGAPSILAGKLGDSFRLGSTNTEYSLNNISKVEDTKDVVPQKPEASKSYPKGSDPYRIQPE